MEVINDVIFVCLRCFIGSIVHYDKD